MRAPAGSWTAEEAHSAAISLSFHLSHLHLLCRIIFRLSFLTCLSHKVELVLCIFSLLVWFPQIEEVTEFWWNSVIWAGWAWKTNTFENKNDRKCATGVVLLVPSNHDIEPALQWFAALCVWLGTPTSWSIPGKWWFSPSRFRITSTSRVQVSESC